MESPVPDVVDAWQGTPEAPGFFETLAVTLQALVLLPWLVSACTQQISLMPQKGLKVQDTYF